MCDAALMEFLNERLVGGQRRFADMTRRMLCDRAPDLLEALDFANDDVFLEPLLFAYCTAANPAVPLQQILFRWLRDSHGDAPIPVRSDDAGFVYLPGVGYLPTGRPRQMFMLREGEPPIFVLTADCETLDCACEGSWMVGDSIELLREQDALLAPLYTNRNGDVFDVEISTIARRQRAHLGRALDLIAGFCPAYYGQIVRTTRALAIFHCPGMNSFAALRAHGMAFLNASHRDNKVFFVEDVAHQCGHVVFSSATFGAEDLLAVHPETPLTQVTGGSQERRTVYEALHGIFTEAVMVRCLSECLARGIFDGAQHHELLGRLGFILRRFGSDVSNLNRAGLFLEEGERLFGAIASVFKAAYDAFGEWAGRLDFSNQLYNFDYERYTALNSSDLSLVR